MANLVRGTRQADSAVQECSCYRDCRPELGGCSTQGWHAHADEPCPVHLPADRPPAS